MAWLDAVLGCRCLRPVTGGRDDPAVPRGPGEPGAYLLRRGDGDRTEFVTITLWDSLAAMRAFTGENGQQPPLPADDARFLIGDAPDVVVYETIDRPG